MSAVAPATFLDLPVEIQLQIIKHLFKSGAPVIPLITSCKTLHNRFGYLIYRLHAYDFTVTPETLREQSVKRLTLGDEKLKELTVLRAKIDKVTRTSYQVHYLSFIGSKKKPHSFHNLVVLSLSTDSTHVLFDLLKVLPTRLQFLFVSYTGRTSGFAQVHARDIYKTTQIDDPKCLKSLRFSSRYSLSKKVLHPHIAPYEISGPLEENVARVERSQRAQQWERSIGLFHQRRIEAQKSLGLLFYDILEGSKESLQEVKFINFDIGMVFDVESGSLPFKMSSLRAFAFDSVSQNGASEWLHTFQKLNMSNTRYKDIQVPLIILNDKLGKVLYYKRVSETYTYELGGPSLLSTWHKAAPGLLKALRRTVDLV